MSNDRNAGRKPILTDADIRTIRERQLAGESISALAAEYGVTRQALYKRLRGKRTDPLKIDYIMDGQLIAEIDADPKSRDINVINYVMELSRLPFGFRDDPSWQDFCDFVEKEYLKSQGVDGPGDFLITDGKKDYSLSEIDSLKPEGVYDELPVFELTKKDILFSRTDTDGFQLKALSDNRRLFIKSQAVISGVYMRDWSVEVIASDIAEQLGISCVKQRHCKCVFAKKSYDGVCSDNFELDGYTFLSFESLIAKRGLSTQESYFVKLGAIEKLKWCATQLEQIGRLPYDMTFKYMLDLAVLDCMVGNVDRHTRNYGLFYNPLHEEYSIPLIFDNGMGLFEHDAYRDRYESFDDAMHNVYVSPYGEDPFDMIRLLDNEFHLKQVYGGVESIHYPDILHTAFALEYERRMNDLWQKLD